MFATIAAASTLFLCPLPTHHDGDAIRCAGRGGRSMRLYGIDAPEMPGACRPGRQCTPGDPYASRDHLSALTRGRAVRCEIVDHDHYGRGVVRCSADGADLSCAMVRDGFAVERYGRLNCSPSAPTATSADAAPRLNLGLGAGFYAVAINSLTYLAFRTDKRRAVRHQFRISESRLLTLAALGGSPAAIYAQQSLRHKNRKQPFATILLLITGLQIGSLLGLGLFQLLG
jgi:uncharacterized membrane protein YsdA (DUF1294 family)